MYLLGYDIGTSSIKVTLMESQRQTVVASATSPDTEMPISAPYPGWAEQDPQNWWENVKEATAAILSQSEISPKDIQAIGLTYQMHGLVLVDTDQNVLRPAIIWCDSRAVEIGQQAAHSIGPEKCLERLCNHPGNFTASKLKWVKDNEPDIYKKADTFLLPGDYIAMKMSGRTTTTETGLSEGIFWDFQSDDISADILDWYGYDLTQFPAIVPTFGTQCSLSSHAAKELGLAPDTPITYRAGDQPNNAFSLNVLEPGQLAATAGTSGVVYGIADKSTWDPHSRVNTFLHVNHSRQHHRYGVLLCVNGTGILNSWLKHNIMNEEDYSQMNETAATVECGSEGLTILPYGNGAERTLLNHDIGASIHNWSFTRHDKAHLLRAAQEGIVFALNHGLDIMKATGLEVRTVRAGHGNMFLSDIFATTFATITGASVELYDTDGSQGAARGAGVGVGLYANMKEAFSGLKKIRQIDPDPTIHKACSEAYDRFLIYLKQSL